MKKKQVQIEIPDLDKTPLGQALKVCADLQDEADEIEEKLSDAKFEAHKILKSMERDQIKSNGFEFKIEIKTGSEKLKMKKLKV